MQREIRAVLVRPLDDVLDERVMLEDTRVVGEQAKEDADQVYLEPMPRETLVKEGRATASTCAPFWLPKKGNTRSNTTIKSSIPKINERVSRELSRV
jgi:hypothetical protein